jgi:hypothetical protein
VKKTVAIALLMILVLLLSAGSSFAWVRGGGAVHGGGGFHGRGVVVVGPGWGWGGPWWGYGWGGYYPGGYYAPPYYYQQPQVVVQPAPIYVERNEEQPQESFWYYCPNTRAYYPSVQSCSEVWVKVPPRSE